MADPTRRSSRRPATSTDEFGTSEVLHQLDALLDHAFDDDGPMAQTLAVVIVHRGEIVVERYAEGIDADTTLISWSMAKSILHAAVGILVGAGRLDLDARAPVAQWSTPGDPRRDITLEHLLTMRDGLAFVEDYVDERVSDVIEMLFGAGKGDVAGFAADRPLAHPPGEVFNYSSGTSNIVSRVLGDAIGGGAAEYEAWLRAELFEPIGMNTATPKFDDAGTFIASSFVYATARDFARFGELYLRDGVWDGRRVLPEGWVDHARRIRSQDEESGNYYGAHWWVVGDDADTAFGHAAGTAFGHAAGTAFGHAAGTAFGHAAGTFWANGYEGQSIMVSPGVDLVVVRLGKTPAERYPELTRFRAEVVATFSG